MKKLLKELEKEFESDNVQWCDGEYQDGFNHARMMVMSHNPWHEVTELPPVCEQEPDFSIDVMVTNGNGYRLGYYAFRTESWVMHKYFRNPSKVTHWAHLPELPK